MSFNPISANTGLLRPYAYEATGPEAEAGVGDQRPRVEALHSPLPRLGKAQNGRWRRLRAAEIRSL